jgi:hypothetical protein
MVHLSMQSHTSGIAKDNRFLRPLACERLLARAMGIHQVTMHCFILCTKHSLTGSVLSRKISPQLTGSDAKTDYDYIIPVVDPSSLDLRCGRNATTAWSKPKTALIHAGDTVGFAVNTSVGLPIAGAPVMPWDVRPTCLLSTARCTVSSSLFCPDSPSNPVPSTLKSYTALAELIPSRTRHSMAFRSSRSPT